MRKDPADFGESELELLFVARKLKEALRVEELLTQSGVDYAVEPDKYMGGTIFRTERVGAFFYVLPEAAAGARSVLSSYGFPEPGL